MAALATLDQLKSYLDKELEADDAVLELMLAGASRWLESACGRKFIAEPALVAGVDSAPAVSKTFSTRYKS